MSKIDEIKKIVRLIEDANNTLRTLDDEKNEIELRIFKGSKGWETLSYKTDHKPVRNFVMHQIRISLNADLKIYKNQLQKLVSEL
ncbi:hypothetical protein OX284_007675 [Flavobacterium sp. SUN046]|uniref:hypothetical protein n=1 Tax=Flavobacterium sp. SUN046 TaxID=3002440 RepID=UPI002DBBC621|nr:hypothetical protein [Flavobacterium sp. SUN046]MEC4049306.1 hypothetical protein [Flavobacterium sp. SUN046]